MMGLAGGRYELNELSYFEERSYKKESEPRGSLKRVAERLA